MRVLYQVIAAVLGALACANAALGWELIEVDGEAALGHMIGSLMLLGVAAVLLFRAGARDEPAALRSSSFADLSGDR